ncbi:uncharacterized protein N7500_004991 [Penicillium coprophilum]|uniref:uncharacterized protein n=1 Tax=Penicillium coprophilum TaxID=36646 RepID=UPI002391D232|nr:uncharacterized protein N7500_004991 [Penicillium coprophilum]KAJ5163161.1 hypothetical protein N7500_004991 [Penicillium coprophilum]
MGFLFASQSDVTLIVIKEPTENDENKTKTALFHVDRAKLIESSAYFRTMFSSRWERAGKYNPTLRGDTIKSMEVILGSIHGFDPEPESVSVTDVWYTMRACNKYLLDPKKLVGWFTRWIQWIDQEDTTIWEDLDFNRQLLFPCYFFDHANAFQQISKRLVYDNPGYITELAPRDSPLFEPMHMPAIAMRKSTSLVSLRPKNSNSQKEQLRAARGRLRTILQRSLFEDVNVTIDYAYCACAAHTIFSYMRELHRIGVRPLDGDIHKNGVRDILNRLKGFNEEKTLNGQSSVQRYTGCSHSWKFVVEHSRKQVEGYFDGLCLDCMHNNPDENSEYWSLDTIRYVYGKDCRISHGQPTWYFSFMGHRDRNPSRMQS